MLRKCCWKSSFIIKRGWRTEPSAECGTQAARSVKAGGSKAGSLYFWFRRSRQKASTFCMELVANSPLAAESTVMSAVPLGLT
jgi:hypothetical protein